MLYEVITIVFHKPREDTRSEFWSIIDPNLNLSEVQILRDEYGVAPQRSYNFV